MSVDEIEKAGNQAAALTRQLLAFSRKQMLQARVVNLNTIVRDMESMLGRLIGERISLATALASDLLNLSVDPVQIAAGDPQSRRQRPRRDARGRPHRAQHAQRRRVPTHGAARPEPLGPCVVLTVRDTGVGMSAQTRAQHLRAVLHHQAGRQGHRPRAAMVYGIVRAERRLRSASQPRRRGHDVHALLPARPTRRRTAASAPERGGRPAIRRTCWWSRTSPRCASWRVARCGAPATRCSWPRTATRRCARSAGARRPRPAAHRRRDARDERPRAGRAAARGPRRTAGALHVRLHRRNPGSTEPGRTGPEFLAKPFTPGALVRQVIDC